jgi:hypothetical protein
MAGIGSTFQSTNLLVVDDDADDDAEYDRWKSICAPPGPLPSFCCCGDGHDRSNHIGPGRMADFAHCKERTKNEDDEGIISYRCGTIKLSNGSRFLLPRLETSRNKTDVYTPEYIM